MKAKIKIKPRIIYRCRKKVIIGGILFSLVLLFLISFFLLFPRITLKGKKTLTIPVHEAYQDPGYSAHAFLQDVSDKVKIKGKVDVDQIGEYQVVYQMKVHGIKTKVVRKVNVADLEAPKIELVGSTKEFVCPGKEYQEFGYSAVDNVDGDITDQVTVEKKKNKIIYQVKDKAGNKAKVERTLMEGDETAPEILLTEGSNDFAFLGESYSDPGYQAIDNCDGDITSQVFVSGGVDTNKVGDYTIHYTVKDQKGNERKVERTVRVREKGAPGTIYLTFDDGPKAGTTDVILDILKEEGVKATFFVTGSGPDSLIVREYQEGHTVGLHTYSHNYALIYDSVDSYFQDLQAVHDRVFQLTGYDSRIIRFPGGSSNTISKHYEEGIMSILTEEVLNRGYQYYDWNITSGDSGDTSNADEVYQNVINHLSKEKVNMILMHDTKPYTRDALQKIIAYGKENGYTFDAITLETAMVRQRVNN